MNTTQTGTELHIMGVTDEQAVCDRCSNNPPATTTREEPAMNRSAIIRAIHAYGRARARADFTIGSDIPVEEVVARINRVRAAQEVIEHMLIDEVIGSRPMSLPLLRAVSDFSVQLYAYGTYRHEGRGPESVIDVADALAALLVLCRP